MEKSIHINKILKLDKINSPKRYRVTKWMKTQDPTIWGLQKTHFTYKNTKKMMVRANENQKWTK